MRIALVNPPWSFEGSIYFGCREPHLPLEYGYAQALLGAAGHEARIFDAHAEALDLPELTGQVAGFAPRYDRRDDRAELPVLALRAAGTAGAATDARGARRHRRNHRRRRSARLDDAARDAAEARASMP